MITQCWHHDKCHLTMDNETGMVSAFVEFATQWEGTEKHMPTSKHINTDWDEYY